MLAAAGSQKEFERDTGKKDGAIANNFRLIDAFYGVFEKGRPKDGLSIDYTEVLKGYIDKGIYSLKIDNKLVGNDPANGHHKYTQIRYVWRGSPGSVVLYEGQLFEITNDGVVESKARLKDETPGVSLVFGKDSAKVVEEDLGKIPDRQYKWLNGDDPDSPNFVNFQLANGDHFEFVPMKRGNFFMSNERGSGKHCHKVTFTRPFWFSRISLTANQWRDFGPNDYDECRAIEKALGGFKPVVLGLRRKQIDDYCAYLTKRYRKQLPKGYVFRLPTEAEWECAADVEATKRKYHKPGVKGWGEFVSVAGETARNNFKEARIAKKLDAICAWQDYGWVDNRQYGVGCWSLPNSRGISDLLGWGRLVLDIEENGKTYEYADEEVDPLRFADGIYDGRRTHLLLRDWEVNRPRKDYRVETRVHVVVGPDLIAEQAWKNKKTVYEVKVRTPQQVKKFDPKLIKSKITKPREQVLKRVGGGETVFCEIPKGSFNMSNVEGQPKLNHRVELKYAFWMSKFLVTIREWREFAPNDFNDPSSLAAERNFSRKYPVCVPGTHAQWRAYCAFMTERYKAALPPGYVFRLPTEAEWEWALISRCR